MFRALRVDHGFMPIEIKAVSEEAFAAWLVEAQEEFADNSDHQDEETASPGVSLALDSSATDVTKESKQ